MKSGNKGRRLRQILLIDLLLLLCIICLLMLARVREDNKRPPLALNGDAVINVDLGSEFSDPGVNNPSARVSGDVDTSVAGTYTVEYSYKGETVTRTVNVMEPRAIVMGLKGSAVQLVKKGDPYIENGAFAVDKGAGTLDESEIAVSGSVDTDTPGDYPVVYTAGSASVTRTVRVLSENDFGDADGLISVLMYNSVYSENSVPAGLNGNWILDKDLEEEFEYLSKHDFYYPGWKEIRAWLDGEISLPQDSLAITFDGGSKDMLKYGVPVIEKYKIPVTVFMICWGKNGAKNKVRKYASEYIDFESNSYAMHQGGQSRGYRGIVADMTKEEIVDDLKKAQAVVGNNDAYAYPYGDVTEDAYDAVKNQGVSCAFTATYGRLNPGMDPYRLPRVRVLGDEGFDIWRESVR